MDFGKSTAHRDECAVQPPPCEKTGAEAPVSVSAHGTSAAVADDRTIPDTVETIHELPSGCLVIFGQYEASGNPAMRGALVRYGSWLGGGRGLVTVAEILKPGSTY